MIKHDFITLINIFTERASLVEGRNKTVCSDERDPTGINWKGEQFQDGFQADGEHLKIH